MTNRAPLPAPRGCDVGVRTDTGDPALPVAGTGTLSRVRKSRNARWRAATLIAVHAAVAAHVTHYLWSGRTLSPVEPSESMYTLELGYLNAGFLFFAVALLGTLAFGRFFCGWGCHIVALQDLCGWLMKKLGIRPRPLRSRLLLFAPLVVALYMFVLPSVLRAFGRTGPFPGFSNHLTTTAFWATFPGPLFGVLTFLTCGFLAVYLLGAKGFCTYGCPYGAMFGVLDRFAVGRIVVNDACEQCGHCTATCTSNVRVHEEVRDYGMVVDPGCMKCLDCVSVCPKGALSFGFARPAVAAARRGSGPTAPRFNLGWFEEALLGAVCLVATLSFYQLFNDGPPLLMSVGLGGITAFACLKLWQLARRPTVRLQNLALKLGGRLRPSGTAFAGLAAAWLLFAGHSGFVRWERAWGTYYLDRTLASRADVLSGAFAQRTYPPQHYRAAERAYRHFAAADRWGLHGVVQVKLGLAWIELLRNDVPAAVAHVREAIALAPANPQLHDNLVDILVAHAELPEAIEAVQRKIGAAGTTARDQCRLGSLLVELGRLEEAADPYGQCVTLAPGSAEVRYNFGGLLRRLGRNAAAVEQLREAGRLAPTDADTQMELGLALLAADTRDEALAAFRRAAELAGDGSETRTRALGLARELESNGVDGARGPERRSS